MSGYQATYQSGIEPVSAADAGQWGNQGLYNVQSGCTLTPSVANMTVDLAAGVITHFGATVLVAALVGAYTLVSDPTYPRWTWLCLSSAGAPVVVSGDPAAVPSVPSYGDRVPVALYLVQAGQTIANNVVYKLNHAVPAPTISEAVGVLTDFRQNRRLVAEFSAGGGVVDPTGTVAYFPVGNGFQLITTAQAAMSAVGGEPVLKVATGSAYTGGVVSGNANAVVAVLSPAKSPRMLARVLFPAAGAGLTNYNVGFFDANGASANGAYLRITTTGNVFFVTRQGGSETVTDLGALSRVAVLGFEIETADAGVTWVCRNQAGTVLATHTSNVPTAGTALAYGTAVVLTSSAQVSGVAYMRVEATFA